MVQWLLDHSPERLVTKEVVIEAARAGQLAILQYLAALSTHKIEKWSKKALDAAAENGHWELVRWIFSRVKITYDFIESNEILLKSAVKQNNLKQVKWLVANGFEVTFSIREKDWRIVDFPKKEEWRTQSEILRYVLSKSEGNCEDVGAYALTQAAVHGDLDFARWVTTCFLLDMDGVDTIEIAVECAARHNHLSVVKWLLSCDSSDCNLSDVMFAAAEYGNRDVVEWLFKRYCRSSDVNLFVEDDHRSLDPDLDDLDPQTAIDVAACNGHLGIIQFLYDAERREQGSSLYKQEVKCTSAAMDGAAANGHLEVVQWLHAHCPEAWSQDAMDKAALSGHLEVVQWLHWNRLERLDARVMHQLAGKCFTQNSLDGEPTYASNLFDQKMLVMLQWLHLNRSAKVTTSVMNAAASNGKLEMVKWLHVDTKAGCTTAAMDRAAWNGHLNIVKWLHVNRSEGCTAAAMDGAASNGHLDVVKWLCANQPESVSSRAMVFAATAGHLQIVRWLIERDTERANVVEAMVEALSRGHFEVAHFLHAQNLNGYSDEEVQSLIRASHEDSSFEAIRNWCEVNFQASATLL